MVEYTQQERRLSVETPLGPDVLLLTSFVGHEEMSRLFSYQLTMLSTESSISPKDIVGKNVTVSVRLPEASSQTHFNGFVSSFGYCGTDDRLSEYRAEVVPWLWFLTRTADCRIFQAMTVPDIIEKIFGDLGFSDYKLDLKGAHKTWEYCVQYRESDFNFVSRLMEQEGIFYFFEHKKGGHTLVLADHTGAYVDCEEKEVDFSKTPTAPVSAAEITSWEHRYEFRPGKCTHTDYNFKTPTTSLMATTNTLVEFDGVSKYEVYDYPGAYPAKGDGDAEVKFRMEEMEAGHDTVAGAGQCRTFRPGGKFTLKTHPSDGEKGKGYVLTGVSHHAAEVGGYETSGPSGELDYSNTFQCIPDKTVFRPERTTPKAVVQGAHTAVVVGPGGEEIHCDEFGRVKVQFHWDREGAMDDKSSCWVRVSQAWAGKGFGFVHIPRIGEEVIVDFLEGDPDRPIITGRVYHAENMPPYGLPDNKTQTGLKSRSSLGGSEDNFNEIRFEDLKGEEEVYIHAEKDENIVVENDKTEEVGHDESIEIGNDRKETVKHDETLTVNNDRTRQVDNNEKVTVSNDQDIQVGANRDVGIGKNDALNVGENHNVSVSKDQRIIVSKNRSMTVSENLEENVSKNFTLSVGKDKTDKIDGKRSVQVTKESVLQAKKIQLVAKDEISLKTGSAEVIMKKNGDITIKGKKINIKGSGDVVIKGSKIKEN